MLKTLNNIKRLIRNILGNLTPLALISRKVKAILANKNTFNYQLYINNPKIQRRNQIDIKILLKTVRIFINVSARHSAWINVRLAHRGDKNYQ